MGKLKSSSLNTRNWRGAIFRDPVPDAMELARKVAGVEMTDPKLQPCERCGEKPIVYCDERTNKWDCVHWCYDRLSGAVNHPTRDAAVQAWNKLVKGNGDAVS